MKIALFGASGTIGQRITAELLRRGHQVTAIVRDPSKMRVEHHVRVVKGDVTNPASVATLANNHNAVVSSVQARPSESDATLVVDAAHALIEGLKKAKVRRLIVVGGAGSLEAGPGLRVMDTPNFPAAWKAIAKAHSDALEVYRADKALDWTFLSPPALIEPGQRTQNFRVGTDKLVVDSEGKSSISTEDFAVALVDELENPRYLRRRFTVGY